MNNVNTSITGYKIYQNVFGSNAEGSVREAVSGAMDKRARGIVKRCESWRDLMLRVR